MTTKAELLKELNAGNCILVKWQTWELRVIAPDGSIGICYKGNINPKTAESLVAQNPAWGKS